MEEKRTEEQKSTLSDVQSGGEAALDAAKRGAHYVAEQAKERLDEEVAEHKGMVAKELGNLGEALDTSARELDNPIACSHSPYVKWLSSANAHRVRLGAREPESWPRRSKASGESSL